MYKEPSPSVYEAFVKMTFFSIFYPVGISTLGPAVFGLLGLFSKSQSASQVTGSEGFFLHKDVNPLSSVGLTYASK